MGDGPSIVFGVSPDPLDVDAAVAAVSTPEAGGIGLFIGTVRASAAAPGHEDEQVVRLEYEAHERLAAARLDEIGRTAAAKWGLLSVVAVHRTGPCDLGEPTVVVACSAPHRAEALDACRWMIDEIKATAPIFKREIYSTGASWVGAEGA